MNKHCAGCSEKKTVSYTATIFTSNGTPVTLNLCKAHDLELFKLGQIKFVEKYRIPFKNGDMLEEVLNMGSDDVFADIA